MAGVLKNIGQITGEIVSHSRKRREIGRYFKNCCLSRSNSGSWIAYKNEFVASGLVIEGSLSDIYISSFIVPIFDKIKFVSWSLGHRIVHCSIDSDTREECRKAIEYYCENLNGVRSPLDLIVYLDESEHTGTYSAWVKYICYLKLDRFEQANEYLYKTDLSRMHQAEIEKLDEIERKAISGDREGVHRVLREWKTISEHVLGSVGDDFDPLADSSYTTQPSR